MSEFDWNWLWLIWPLSGSIGVIWIGNRMNEEMNLGVLGQIQTVAMIIPGMIIGPGVWLIWLMFEREFGRKR